ncbi:glycosyltransferase family 2 protein [Microbacterium lacus]|uniref:glycosyltransferase family 2 protein n=1 Tax=Microbacterium lacus TaxID=415217 RepID=UPI000C2B63DF|nr:glycosyltransferase family 2 protein [Microbacterium lacus]
MQTERQNSENRPFLSVVVRTQGRRLEALADAMLCLYGQSSADFEVLLVCHDADPASAVSISALVESQPASFRERISTIEVTGGRRARPLNVATERAQGRYIAFYDDDDLLFGHWVEAFRISAERAPGRLLRARVASQRAIPEMWPQDQDGFRHTSWPNTEYPAHFDQLAHFGMNYSPFMGWAFPRELFHTYGLRFDEELYVCEDWDMILRGSLICGVEEVHELTAIYRRWEGIESSYTSHHSAEWEASQARVIARLNESPIIFPPGTVMEILALLSARSELNNVRGGLEAIYTSRSWRITEPVRGVLRYAASGARFTKRAVRRVIPSRSSQ